MNSPLSGSQNVSCISPAAPVDAGRDAADPQYHRHGPSSAPIIAGIVRTPKLTFAGLRLAVGLVLATATPSQAGTTGDTTSSTLVKFMGVGANFTTAAVGNIGLTAQEKGATIEFNLATWNTFPHTQFFDFLTGFVWIDLGSTAGPPDFRADASPIRDIVSIGSPSHEYILQLGTITFSPLRPGTAAAPFEHFEVTFSAPADTHGNPAKSRTVIIRGDEQITLGVTLQQFGDPSLAIEPDMALIHMQLTGSGPLPKLPSLFTDEQRAKFRYDAGKLKELSTGLGALNGSMGSNPAASLSNLAASQLTSAISPQVGTANSTLQTALSMTNALISVPTNPISLILSLTGTLNKSTAGILDFLANLDPPDGNYLEVFDAPDWSFGDIVGASAAGNALVRDSWALFQESLNMLAAAERFQGADLAGDADAKAMQEAAFSAALDRYNQNRVSLADSLIAFLAELEADEAVNLKDDTSLAALAAEPLVEDVNLEDDTSLADLQNYLAGLDDPATEDPLLAAWIASMTKALPGLLAQPGTDEPSFIAQAVIDAVDAIENMTPSGLTGSAFATIRTNAESLATTPPEETSRLLNLSTRGLVQTGDNVLIPGFVISGTANKKLLIRAVGPTLGKHPFNLAGVLANPRMTLKKFNDTVSPTRYDDIANNDDWATNTNAAAITQTASDLSAFAFNDDREAALLMDLAPGQYTVVADGVSTGTGIAIVELYDDDTASVDSRLINISNRGFCGIGDQVMIPGFVVSSESPRTVLIRVVGPTLGGDPFNVPGTMPDPKLELYRREAGGTETLVATQDNWSEHPNAATTAQIAQQVQAFALVNGSKDAAFVVTLTPGSYTVVGSSAITGGSGVVLVEVYVVP